MSKRKHNISYIKPNEPKFLRELKEQIGFKEGPTIESKRQVFVEDLEDERKEEIEEKPVVVVLKPGDLTADEADALKKKRDEEEANAPADLNKPIVFRNTKSSESIVHLKVKKSKKSKVQKSILSFDENEEEEDY